jgi:hypothetical protein
VWKVDTVVGLPVGLTIEGATQPLPKGKPMKQKKKLKLLIGQLTADALVMDALLMSLMELAPGIHTRILAKVAATAPGRRLLFQGDIQKSFDSRIQERRDFFHAALEP